jgi:polyisoprenoid-binding protein YceI
MQKQIIYLIGFLVVIGAGTYLYFSKPVAAPTNSDINSEVVPVENTNTDEEVAGTQEVRGTIQQSDSTAEFRINEDLRGEPKLVIGTTNQIAGEVVMKESGDNFVITVGEVKVNARTLKTDSEQRNGALARAILKSEDAENEFITFKPKNQITVPSASIASNFNFTLTGELTIRGVTKTVSFSGTGKIANEAFSGTAQTTLNYTDYGISIPSVPFVANVDKTTTLVVKFVAK